MAREVDHRPDTRLGVALAAVVLLSSLGPVLWARSVADRLPDEVVRHWGADGLPTATWPLATQLSVLTAVTLLLAGGVGAVSVLSRLPLVTRRVLGGTAAFTAALFAVLQVGGLRAQLDLEDALAAPSTTDVLLAAVGIGLLVAVAVASLAREGAHGRAAAGPPPPDAPRLPGDLRTEDGTAGADDGVAVDDGPVWASPAHTSRAMVGVGVSVLVLFTLITIPVGGVLAGIGVWSLGAVTAGVVVASSRFRVTIDGDGLSVRGPGHRLLHVPVAEVARADVVDHLDPFWEFGGWGLRTDARGRTGVVSRRGEALHVVRGDGTEVLVTIDDAAAAAATLNTLADRAHAGR